MMSRPAVCLGSLGLGFVSADGVYGVGDAGKAGQRAAEEAHLHGAMIVTVHHPFHQALELFDLVFQLVQGFFWKELCGFLGGWLLLQLAED
ncbi:MAG: hypothetical protein R3B71_01630 [Candidatus Gracilibacteria bacterium]